MLLFVLLSVAVNCSLTHAWQDGKGKVHEIKDMDCKFILSAMMCTTDIMSAAWEYEKDRVVEPASNAPKGYIDTLPDRYLLAPPIYWELRKELRTRGWID